MAIHWLVPVLVLTVALVLVCVDDAEAQPKGFNYDEAKVPAYTLPDPLTFNDGTKVKSADLWKNKRRGEVLDLFKQHVFGAMPPAKKIARAETHSYKEDALDGKARLLQVTLHLTDDDNGPSIPVCIFLPPEGKTSGPVPAFLGYNFNGNHTVHPSEDIRMSAVWERRKGATPKVPDESTRGKSASRWQVEMILERGYALATVYYGDVDPDFHDGFKDGIHTLYPDYQNRDDNWTSIGGWAWGLSRVLDYLETNDHVDAKRVAVIGHSRLGKTSLWGGATDERFALVISNNSGCGGAALARRRFGETVKRINTSFPHWFCKTHKQYNDNEDAMPVDHHELIALMAPRPVYVASAEDDRWADPRGEFLSCVGADPVYRLLGTEGLPTHDWPPVNTPVVGRIGYHVRTGKHDVTAYDWEQYLNFADKWFSKR